MANDEHLAILKQGVKVWNNWKGKNLECDNNPDEVVQDFFHMIEIGYS
ncbi:hypothetical protein [Anabaena sp. UHCC 0451]|nr:hypothetical protein [Anabaena sp. UHCC 0451]MEA5574907.1 hypothetical protein [Anabaena sp. UHCC 0451]